MEVYFPHLTNGIVQPKRIKKTTSRIKLLAFLAITLFGFLLFFQSAWASTMNQEMIAQQERLQVEVCYELKKDINEFMYLHLVMSGESQMAAETAKHLEMLTTSYANFCKR